MTLTPDSLAAWVAASCAEQNVPLKVTDATVLAQVRVLLASPHRTGRHPAPPHPSGRE